MALKGKKPETIEKRLKLMVYGESGVGKTLAAAQFPDNYFIDTEHGVDNYADKLKEAKASVFQTSDADDVMEEVRSLLTEEHEFRTLTIDPITPVYTDVLEKGERLVGTEWGRHYGHATKVFKRLMNLLTLLDMNVIMTCHARTEYGDEMKKIGITFDGWKKLDYVFDLVLQLERQGIKRIAIVKKTRLAAFPDGDSFEWSYAEFVKRCGGIIAAKAKVAKLATTKQVTEIEKLIEVVTLPDGTVEKWWKKAEVDGWADMTHDAIQKCIEHMQVLVNKVVAERAAFPAEEAAA